MEKNILIAGVGGQGILSVAFGICNSALHEGLHFKQSEVHGMAQRGGAVQSNLRISNEPLSSDLIPQGRCDLLLAVEPLEAIRYRPYLGKESVAVVSMNSFVNIENYPKMEWIWQQLKDIGQFIPIDAGALARKAGSALAQGMVMLGAGSVFLPLKAESIQDSLHTLWQAKGEQVLATNLKAFAAGRKMAEFLRTAAVEGANQEGLRALAAGVPSELADAGKASEWVNLLKETPQEKWAAVVSAKVA